MYDVRPKGSGFESVNALQLVASTDEWFSPIVAEVGPDGNLWIADWYNFIIQHNPTPNLNRGGYDAQRGPGNAHINPNRDRQHGRIYRLVYQKNHAPAFNLENATWEKLVKALSHDNMFWRLTAQSVSWSNRGYPRKAVPALIRKLLTQAPLRNPCTHFGLCRAWVRSTARLACQMSRYRTTRPSGVTRVRALPA